MELDSDYQLTEYYPTKREYNDNRDLFYADHISIEKFNDLCEEHIENISQYKTFYDRFSIYFSLVPEVEVWASLTIIYNGKGKKVYRWMGYSVSTSGRIWSHITNKEITLNKANNGYYNANIRNGNERTKHLSTHRCVLSAFTYDVKLPKENLTVNHKKPNGENNHLLNLEWVTKLDNILDAKKRNGFSVKITLTQDFEQYKAGEVYYVHRNSELTSRGISKHGIMNSFRKGYSSYGCKWEKISDTSTTIPDDLIELISRYKK